MIKCAERDEKMDGKARDAKLDLIRGNLQKQLATCVIQEGPPTSGHFSHSPISLRHATRHHDRSRRDHDTDT